MGILRPKCLQYTRISVACSIQFHIIFTSAPFHYQVFLQTTPQTTC